MLLQSRISVTCTLPTYTCYAALFISTATVVIVQVFSHVHLAHLHMLRGIIIISAHVVTVQDISHVHLAHLHTFYAALFIIAHM